MPAFPSPAPCSNVPPWRDGCWWRAHFFGVDLARAEIAPPLAALVTPVNAPHSEAVNATVTRDALLNARAVNAWKRPVTLQSTVSDVLTGSPTGSPPRLGPPGDSMSSPHGIET